MVSPYQQTGEVRDHQTHPAMLPLTATGLPPAPRSKPARRDAARPGAKTAGIPFLRASRLIRQRSFHSAPAAIAGAET